MKLFYFLTAILMSCSISNAGSSVHVYIGIGNQPRYQAPRYVPPVICQTPIYVPPPVVYCPPVYYQQPVYQQPVVYYQQPVYQAPVVYYQPRYYQPVYYQPVYRRDCYSNTYHNRYHR